MGTRTTQEDMREWWCIWSFPGRVGTDGKRRGLGVGRGRGLGSVSSDAGGSSAGLSAGPRTGSEAGVFQGARPSGRKLCRGRSGLGLWDCPGPCGAAAGPGLECGLRLWPDHPAQPWFPEWPRGFSGASATDTKSQASRSAWRRPNGTGADLVPGQQAGSSAGHAWLLPWRWALRLQASEGGRCPE